MNVAFFKNFWQLSMLKKFSTRPKVRIQAVFFLQMRPHLQLQLVQGRFFTKTLKSFFPELYDCKLVLAIYTKTTVFHSFLCVSSAREHLCPLQGQTVFFLMQFFKVVVTELNQLKSNDINTVKQGAKATIFISSANPVKTCWFPPQHEKELCQLKVNLGRKMTFWLQYLETRCSDNIPTVFN